MLIHNIHFAILFVFWLYATLFLIAPVVLRFQFRYNASLEPQAIAAEEVPGDARALIEPRVAELAAWNFELVSYVKVANIAGAVAAYLALLANRHTAEWADVTVVTAGARKVSYVEFITRCSEQMQIDTNTSPAAPILFSVPQHQIFRFPQVRDVFTLYRIHRMLVTEITHGALPVIPPEGEELAEYKRRLDRFGPWQQEHGYMKLDRNGKTYRLTWKGAILGAWRSIWPISLLRRWRERAQSRSVLRRLPETT